MQRRNKRLLISQLGIVLVVCATTIAAGTAPASAKNVCGPLGVYKDSYSTGHVVQSCDAKTQATYIIKCLGGTTQVSRYYQTAWTATTNFRCANDAGPIFGVDVKYR